MPRKRKSLSSSPKRRVSITDFSSVPSSSVGLPLPPAMSNNREDVLMSMCEMFPHLDPSLVAMVLGQCKEDEEAISYLLELSTSTKGNTPESTGFDEVASFLDGSQDPETFEAVPNPAEELQDASYTDETVCNDLDTLLDEALDKYGLNNEEILKCEGTTLLHNKMKPGGDQDTSFLKDESVAEDYTHALETDAATIEWKTALNNSVLGSTHFGNISSQENVGSIEKFTEVHQPFSGALSATLHVKPPSVPSQSQIKWNPMASSFYPTSNVNPSFIAPVAVNPSQWTSGRREPVAGVCYNPIPPPLPCGWNFNHFSPSHWNTEPIKPINNVHSGPLISKKVTQLVGKVLVLLRGAPGSGKTTLARLLLEQNPSGVILSTDDYFSLNGEYRYDITCLGEAHEWNHKRAKDAFEKNISPIIIDNTNLQGWEMKPYVSMAMKHKYKVTFREPETWWKFKPKELERRNRHGVKKEKIIKMLENYERVTVNSILNLSHPKTSKNDDNKKADEKTEELNSSPPSVKEEEMALSPTMENIAAMSNALQKTLEIPEDDRKLLPEVEKSNIRNLTATAGDNHIVQNVNTSIELWRNDDISADITSVDAQGLDIENMSSLLIERPELLNFVGDWPVEQTMSQRVPRSRKPRARHEKPNSVQNIGKNHNSTEQIHNSIKDEQVDNKSREEDRLPEAADVDMEQHIDSSVNCDSQEHILELEDQLCNLLTLQDMDNSPKEGVESENMLIDKISDAQSQDGIYAEGVGTKSTSSVNEDVKTKPRHPRRSCRHCKLALNFTNNCSTSSKHEESECSQQTSIGPCKSSQTEPQDFALAWRLERRNAEVLDSAKIILGKSSRFTSKSVDGDSENIPYRVMHHKSTFVEEEDIVSLGDQDGLDILCKLFRSLSFDVLKDLFERCNKDIVWTTNLLLDSGEKMYKDEEWEDVESCSDSDKVNLQDDNSVTEETSDIIAGEPLENDFADIIRSKSSEYSPFVNALPLVVAEELKNGNVLSSNEMNLGHQCRMSSELQERFPTHETITDTLTSDLLWPSTLETDHPNSGGSPLNVLQSNNALKLNKGNNQDINFDNAKNADLYGSEILADEDNDEHEVQEVTADLERVEKMQEQNNSRPQAKESLKFDYLELALPPEFAFQLTELFGPVGIDPGSLTIEDCVVPIDLKLAECIHKKWKESIQERHRQEALSYQLIFQDSLPDDPLNIDISQKSESEVSQRDTERLPFMDQWNTRVKKVSLRQIIAEEMALQAHQDAKKSSSSKNCAEKLKEKQLLELFPHVEPQLLLDIFKENNYSIEKTKQFMSSVLESDPVQNVIAQGFKHAVSPATDKNKEKKLKPEKELIERTFQDLDYPNYDDFRAEAFLYHQKQQESYRKAAEAHNRGMKQVAAYYAQQGYLYGQKMKEENRRAAVQIFVRANEYLLPENILDLHGLHVDEAMKHFRKVLQDKIDEFKQNGGKPHLLVITGRGNHSQGGVPRIKPAVIDFLTNHDYRFQEKTPGVLRVNLK